MLIPTIFYDKRTIMFSYIKWFNNNANGIDQLIKEFNRTYSWNIFFVNDIFMEYRYLA
jgi:hypothetical protein